MRLTILAVLFCLPCFGYSWRGQIDLGTATAGTLSNITLVSVTVSDSHLKTAANGGTIQNATCSHVTSGLPCDLRLTDDINCGVGSTAYKWGYETYDGTAGTARFFILVPSLTASAHALPYVCTDDSTVSSYQGGAPGAEFDSTAADYHLANGTTLSMLDFSGNANTATNNNGVAATTGKIDGGSNGFSAGSAFISFPNAASLNITGTITLSAWVFLNASTDAQILDKGAGCVNNPAYGLSVGTGFSAANRWGFQVSSATFTTTKVIDTVNASTGVWTYVVGTWDGTTARLFVNGAQANSTPFAGPIYTNTNLVAAGADSGCGGRWFVNGAIDELSIENTTRSAAWIATKYGNQNAPPAITGWTPLGASTAFPPAIY